MTGVLDLGVDTQSFSDQWRQGRLQIVIPAIPAATNPAAAITFIIQDTIDGSNFSNTDSQLVVPGVASTGIEAQDADMPLPPGLRGPIRILQSVSAAIGGDCSATLVAFWWLNE